MILRGFGALTTLLRTRRPAPEHRPGGGPDRDASFVATRLPPLIAVGFGLAFVLINAPALPGPWPMRAAVAGTALAVAVAAWILLRRPDPAPRPRRHALNVYWRWVGIEAAAIFVGARSLMWLDAKQFGVIWVIAVVGVHFLPFARAFRRPSYRGLGIVLITLALLGAWATAALGTTGAGLAGVAAGAVLLVFAAVFTWAPGRSEY